MTPTERAAELDQLPERCYYDCPRCHGTGGPAPVWDDELSRWHYYVCSSCSGSGAYWHFDDDPRGCP